MAIVNDLENVGVVGSDDRRVVLGSANPDRIRTINIQPLLNSIQRENKCLGKVREILDQCNIGHRIPRYGAV
jgi:hypothetical protein